MANQPSLIPSAWAANNSTTETIPATTSESGKASWDQGFPVETSLPLSEGGIPPKYGDFNGVLNVLSQFCIFAQSGGQYAWVNSLDYSVGSIVLGTDGSIYRAAQVSGPSTTAVNPVGDTSGKWERIVSKSDIDALEEDIQDAMDAASDAASNASAAQSAVSTLDANVVKLSGAQTISGIKTFSDGIKFTLGDAISRNANTSELRVHGGTTLNDGGSLIAYGKNSTQLPGAFLFRAHDGTNSKDLRGFPNGTLTWDGNNIITAAGGTMTGGFVLNGELCRSGNAAGGISIYNGTSPSDGGGIWIYGKSHSVRPGWILLQTYTTQYRSLYFDGTNFNPSASNIYSLGTTNNRWATIWQQNGAVTGSDERIKTSIEAIPDAVLDAWGEVDWRQFQMRDAVKKKGENARLHTGMIAQRIDDAFKAHGVDASRYGLFCHDSWEARDAEYDEKGEVTIPAIKAGDEYSLRYDEALCVEAAYQRRRADRAEARITALEQRLGELEAVLASLVAPVGDETYEQFTEQEQGTSDEN